MRKWMRFTAVPLLAAALVTGCSEQSGPLGPGDLSSALRPSAAKAPTPQGKTGPVGGGTVEPLSEYVMPVP